MGRYDSGVRCTVFVLEQIHGGIISACPAQYHGANPAKISSMLEFVKNMFSDNCIGEDIKNFQMEPYEQYVLSNSTSVGGATVLLYPEVMEHLAQGAGANFFILPAVFMKVF